MATIIDFSSAFPSAQAIKSAGHSGAVLYISPPREGWMGAKPATREVVQEYQNAGLELAFVWQFGAGSRATSDVMRGARGGELDARSADEQLKAIGCEGWPVYFSVDFDISLADWNNTARDYFIAAGKVLGRDRVGIYGHSRVVHWAGPENKVVAEVAPGRFLGWVTRSWGSVNPDGSGTRGSWTPGPTLVLWSEELWSMSTTSDMNTGDRGHRADSPARHPLFRRGNLWHHPFRSTPAGPETRHGWPRL